MMNRRRFLKLSLCTGIAPAALADDPKTYEDRYVCDRLVRSDDPISRLIGPVDPLSRLNVEAPVTEPTPRGPVFLSAQDYVVGKRLHQRLRGVQSIVGHGNFNIVGFDEALSYARRYGRVGAFERDELDLFEKLFFADASQYGFYGEKVVESMTRSFRRREMVKVPYTGHFLYKGDAMAHYERIRRSVGDSIILTSGVRSVVKQMYLFLNKAYRVKGNLSLASNSLAPAGYSFHGVGDFDVGKVGYGYRNFTASFEDTDEFKRLMELGFVDIRYTQKNPFGVRYEPWHIKVV